MAEEADVTLSWVEVLAATAELAGRMGEYVSTRWVYNAEVLRVVDGDTLDLSIDLGFRTFVKVRCRLYGIDTPEKFGVKKESEEYQRGMAATDFVMGWMSDLGNRVVIKTYDAKPLGQGKYGRWLVYVYPPSGHGPSLNEELVSSGNARVANY